MGASPNCTVLNQDSRASKYTKVTIQKMGGWVDGWMGGWVDGWMVIKTSQKMLLSYFSCKINFFMFMLYALISVFSQ